MITFNSKYGDAQMNQMHLIYVQGSPNCFLTERAHKRGIYSGFNSRQASPKVQNRGISCPIKMTYVLQNFFKRIHFFFQFPSFFSCHPVLIGAFKLSLLYTYDYFRLVHIHLQSNIAFDWIRFGFRSEPSFAQTHQPYMKITWQIPNIGHRLLVVNMKVMQH